MAWASGSVPQSNRLQSRPDAPRMGKRLKERKITLDLMISSPAKRAFKTCQAIAEILEYPVAKIKTEKKFYHADPDDILSILKTIKDPNEVVMIFGHNPGLTDFANVLLNETIMNIPTAGVIGSKLNIEKWTEAKTGCGAMLFFDFPKNKAE